MQKETFKILGIPVYQRSVTTGLKEEAAANAWNNVKGSVAHAGVNIDNDTAQTISAVWRAVNVVSGSMAFLPLHVYRKNNDGDREYLPTHPIQITLDNPNPLSTDFVFRQTMQAFKMLWGNAYAVIRRNEASGWPEEIIPVHPSLVNPVKTPDGQLVYHVLSGNNKYQVMARDMLHFPGLGFDGISGKSVIQVQRESLGLTKAAERFGAQFFANGANMSGAIVVPGKMDDIAFGRLKTSWDEAYSGLNNSHKTVILEGGSDYKRIGIPPNDAQFLETRKFQLSEIARWYGVAPHLLFDLERSTNNNIEHQGIEFVIYTLASEIACWEAELRKKLFEKTLRPTHYIEFNLNALLRGDSKSRGEFYKGQFAVGAITPNEIRKLENMRAYDGGDEYYVQAGYVPQSLIKEVYQKKFTKNGNQTTP
jgi:HK97 family phage portal protein